nr:protein GPR107-like [Ciona intestinalis]|eukprot:XP_002126310.1 protein GPR107-like [Ciona intestinalis]
MQVCVLSLLILLQRFVVEGRIHTLALQKDERTSILLNSFGYLEGGLLDIGVSMKFQLSDIEKLHEKVGFTVDLSSSGNASTYVEHNQLVRSNKCILNQNIIQEEYDNVPRALLVYDKEETLKVYDRDLNNLTFYECADSWRNTGDETTTTADTTSRTQRGSTLVVHAPTLQTGFKFVKSLPAPTSHIGATNKLVEIRTSFFFHVDNQVQEGLYEVYFRNCLIQDDTKSTLPVTMHVNITARNKGTYLSAGEIALPTIYGVMATMFFLTGLVWLYVLCSTKNPVFTIHYLMAALIFTKGLSITFHAVDYYFIGKDGKLEAWAIIFYIIHLLKGILLFMCLLLIATGWAFIKYILNDREKKIIMVVIPLQVITNVAYIIMDTEKGNSLYQSWASVMVAVDILCVALVIIPIIWSIRHLQSASETDGKAAMNLAKLKLFQNFYVLIIFYLYVTRIVIYIMNGTLPFHYQWLFNLFQELGAFLFFVITGYKFRPGCNNPYLQVPQEDDEESHAITKSGMMENVNKVNQREKDVEDTNEEDSLLPKQRMSVV